MNNPKSATTSGSTTTTTTRSKNATAGQWTPLVYPALAVRNDNPFFPLEQHVLCAATRELLILDQSVNASTLELRSACADTATKTANGHVRRDGESTTTAAAAGSSSSSHHVGAAMEGTSAGPAYLCHLYPKQWHNDADTMACRRPPKAMETGRKRVAAAGTGSRAVSRKRTKTRATSQSSSYDEVVRFQQEDDDEMTKNVEGVAACSETMDGTVIVNERINDYTCYDHRVAAVDHESVVSNAEDLVDLIVQRAACSSCYCSPSSLASEGGAGQHVLLGHEQTTVETPLSVELSYSRRATPAFPRKVSDADFLDKVNSASSTCLTLYNDDAIQRLEYTTHGRNDISRFYHLRNRGLLVAEEQLPPFLEVSIASELVLREVAHDAVQKLTATFDDGTLRRFLGYKSSMLKRDRLLVLLADYLFDVSHAMFAWKQTEEELRWKSLSSRQAASGSSDASILHALFDSRALRKIGGFEKSSLLPHALSISRLSKTGVPWKDFARTKKGKALLQHHRNGKALIVGQKRRGLRVRTRHHVVVSTTSSECSETASRSRSSSITSHDGIIIESSSSRLDASASLQMPDVLRISLRKSGTNSWGVLLSKEGDMCVVVRAPASAGPNGGTAGNETVGLIVGDVILSIGNERQDGRKDWFRFVVDMFKSSNELNLVVRRVGSCQ